MANGTPQAGSQPASRPSTTGTGNAALAALERARQEEIKKAHLKSLLIACEPLSSSDHDSLLMIGYPDEATMLTAARNRHLWAFFMASFFCLFIAAIWNMLPAWIGGVAFGLFLLCGGMLYEPVRQVINAADSYRALKRKRKEMEFRAITHIRYLEEPGRLAYACSKLIPFNRELDKQVFRRMMVLSKKGQLSHIINTRQRIQFYYLLIAEASKGYRRAKADYQEAAKRLMEYEAASVPVATAEAQAPPAEVPEPAKPTPEQTQPSATEVAQPATGTTKPQADTGQAARKPAPAEAAAATQATAQPAATNAKPAANRSATAQRPPRPRTRTPTR